MTGYFVTPIVVGIDTNDDYLVGIDIKFQSCERREETKIINIIQRSSFKASYGYELVYM